MDGTITTFAIVMGVNLNVGTILVLGVSDIFSDGLPMALGDYLSSKAEIDFNKAETDREA